MGLTVVFVVAAIVTTIVSGMHTEIISVARKLPMFRFRLIKRY